MKLYLILLLTISNTLYIKGQTDLYEFDLYFSQLNGLEFELAYETINTIPNSYKNQLFDLTRLIESNGIISEDTIPILIYNTNEEMLTESNFGTALQHLINGFHQVSFLENRANALASFKKALEVADKLKYNPLKKISLQGILIVFSKGFTQNNSDYQEYLNDYKQLIRGPIDEFWLGYYNIELSNQFAHYYDNKHENDKYFKEELQKVNLLRPLTKTNSRILMLIDKLNGDYYVKSDGKKAKAYYEQSFKRLDSSPYFNGHYFRLNLDIARSEAIQGNYNKAIDILHKNKDLNNFGKKLVNDLNYNFFLSEYHQKVERHDSANYYLRNVFALEEKSNFNRHNREVSQLKVELDTLEKEKRALKNRNIAYGLGGLLLFGSITFLLIQKNTKRKQLLAEQEKELQIQKVGTLMKEQELASIDAMIVGQEKERQRIANDLHDDLGGMMATVKLHFNTLKDKPSDELYNKTDKLLDEAYEKVRSIAHSKNSGVIAKHGLLKSINDMAQKVSSPGKIDIDVVDHGLENRLENSLELTIFRIIQELVTNVIKHANANQATIHLTQHKNSLNVMVEDNGKGFNTKRIQKAQGMGIYSIDKRVENLGGTVTIESEINKGSTIIIDLPI